MPETVVMPAIGFEKETLGKILRNRVGLKVPRNQRSYKWEDDHVKDLFDDLNKAITERSAEYFLGSVIIVADARNGTIEVYDGQQRLATTAMIIGGIRDFIHLKLSDVRESQTITGQMLISNERRGVVVPKFRLSANDHTFFENYVLRDPDDALRKAAKPDDKKESHALMKKASDDIALFLIDVTKHLDTAAQFEILQTWLEFLESSARVIWVEVSDQATAYRIFETMNDRGLKLSAADLLKNFLYSLAGEREEEVISRWQSMTGVLESLGKEDGDVVDYLRYLWVSENGHTRSPVLFDRIKAKISSEATAVEFAEKLDLRVNDYAAILTPSHPHWVGYHEEIRHDIQTLKHLNVSQVLPLLLAALTKFKAADIERLFKNAVNWSVRCLLAGVSSANLEGHYSKNAKAITAGMLTSVEAIAGEMSLIIPADDQFVAAVAVASVPVQSLARYYLRVLQLVADGSKQPQYEPSAKKGVTAEHVLPKNPSIEWGINTQDDKALAKRLVSRLGNQALIALEPNGKMGNRSFPVKKPFLLESEFSLTKMAGEIDGDRWGEAEIATRQTTLASYAVSAWPLMV